MYQRPGTTAEQLGSVALRYRLELNHRGTAAAGSARWWPGRGEQRGDDEPRGSSPHARSPRMQRLEAVLLIAQNPLNTRKLAQLAGLADGTKARTLVRELNRRYDAEGSAFRVEEIAGGFTLLTRPQFAPWLRRLHAAQVEVRLSAPAMETLAVVAYRQPVLRAEIEAIRGVQCGEMLRQLIERDLVRIAGRSEELGRPLLYGTTKRFLQVFGLRHLDELPRKEILQRVGVAEIDPNSDSNTDSSETNQAISAGTDSSHAAEEEMNVKKMISLATVETTLADEMATSAVVVDETGTTTPLKAQDDLDDDDGDDDEEDEDDDYDEDFDDDYDDDYDDDFDDDEEGEEEDDDEFEDDEWEEVGDEDEDEDWEEDDDEEDEDWEEEDEDEEEEEKEK